MKRLGRHKHAYTRRKTCVTKAMEVMTILLVAFFY